MNDEGKGGSAYLNAKLAFARDTLLGKPAEGGAAAAGEEGGGSAEPRNKI